MVNNSSPRFLSLTEGTASSDLAQEDPETTFSYSDKAAILKMQLASCGTLLVKHRFCPDCGRTYDELHKDTCGIRYAPCCASFRFKKAFSRLLDYKVRYKELVHLSIGFPRDAGTIRDRKKILDFVTTEFIRDMKKAGYPFRGFKVFDMADKRDPFLHYHLGIFPTMWIDIRKLMRIRRKTIQRTGHRFTVRVFGLRSKFALYEYFAKRIAGLYGHSDDKFINYLSDDGESTPLFYGYTLSESIGIEDFANTVRGFRALTVLGRVQKSCSNIAPVSEQCCKFCGSEFLETTTLVYPGDKYPDVPQYMHDRIPPPDPKIDLEPLNSLRKGSREYFEMLGSIRRDRVSRLRFALETEKRNEPTEAELISSLGWCGIRHPRIWNRDESSVGVAPPACSMLRLGQRAPSSMIKDFTGSWERSDAVDVVLGRGDGDGPSTAAPPVPLRDRVLSEIDRGDGSYNHLMMALCSSRSSDGARDTFALDKAIEELAELCLIHEGTPGKWVKA